MTNEIIVPDLAESTVEATVGSWLKKKGDQVSVGEILVELDTDKVSLEVSSPCNGLLSNIFKNEGDVVMVGEILGSIQESESIEKDTHDPQEPESVKIPAETKNIPDILITPVAKKLAEKENIEISSIKGTGPMGKISKNDIESLVTKKNSSKVYSDTVSEKNNQNKKEEIVKLTRRRITIAKRLKEVQSETVMTTTYNEVDLSSVINIRKKFQDQFVKKHGIKLGFMSFFVKATVNALQSFPHLNSELLENELIVKKYYDMGIAVATEEGLVVPVLRDADKKSSAQIEQDIAQLATKSRDKKITLQELQGGTFSITNGGVFGSLMSTPLLNPPQVGILGMHKIQEKPIALNGEVVIRPVMVLAVTYDHRIIDGAMAVQFLVRIKNLLEDPYQLLIDA